MVVLESCVPQCLDTGRTEYVLYKNTFTKKNSGYSGFNFMARHRKMLKSFLTMLPVLVLCSSNKMLSKTGAESLFTKPGLGSALTKQWSINRLCCAENNVLIKDCTVDKHLY